MHQKGSKNALAQKLNKDPLLKNFIDYVRFDTKADPDSNTVPSSKGQLELGAFIVEKIKVLGQQRICLKLFRITSKELI